MRAENLMKAIGNIDDRHIEEFLIVEKRIKSKTIKNIYTLVASICVLILCSALMYGHYRSLSPNEGGGNVVSSESEDENTTSIIDIRNVVWRTGVHSFEAIDYEKITGGMTVVAPSLKRAFEQYTDEDVVFAIFVEKVLGSQSEVYHSFIKEAGVAEEYMEMGLIYATRQQVEKLSCDRNIAVVLHWAEKSEEQDVQVTIDNCEGILKEHQEVVVFFVEDEIRVQGIMQELFASEKYLSEKELRLLRNAKFKELSETIMEPVLEEYNISEDAIIFKSSVMSYMRVVLSKEQIVKLLQDERIGVVYMVGDTVVQPY